MISCGSVDQQVSTGYFWLVFGMVEVKWQLGVESFEDLAGLNIQCGISTYVWDEQTPWVDGLLSSCRDMDFLT